MRGETNPLFLIALLLVPFAFFLTFPMEEIIPLPFWLNDTFEFRKDIVINATIARETEEIIIPLIFNSTPLISDGKMQVNCSDIRVTSQQVELTYFLEPHTCNTNETIVWVETTIFLQNSTINNTHRIYYGNSTAITESTKAVFNKTVATYLGYRSTPTTDTPDLGTSGQSVNYFNTLPNEIKGFHGNTTNLSERNDGGELGTNINYPTVFGGNYTLYSWVRINKDKTIFNEQYLYGSVKLLLKWANVTADQNVYRWTCFSTNTTDGTQNLNTSLEIPEQTWFFGACALNQTSLTAFTSNRTVFSETVGELRGGFFGDIGAKRLGVVQSGQSNFNMNGTYDSFFIYNNTKPTTFLNILATINSNEQNQINISQGFK